jgi:hypothetical protein
MASSSVWLADCEMSFKTAPPDTVNHLQCLKTAREALVCPAWACPEADFMKGEPNFHQARVNSHAERHNYLVEFY